MTISLFHLIINDNIFGTEIVGISNGDQLEDPDLLVG
jgi:hypothetical protein